MRRLALALTLAFGLSAPSAAETLRIATYDVGLTRDGPGLLLAELAAPPEGALAGVLAVIRAARPDVLLLTGFDHDHRGLALAAFRARLGEGPDGIAYPYAFDAPVNAGEPSRRDLDGDGRTMGPGDARGWGRFPGQGGMALLSRLPLDPSAASVLPPACAGGTFPEPRCRSAPTAAPFPTRRPAASSGCRRGRIGTSRSSCPTAGACTCSRRIRPRRSSTGRRASTATATPTSSPSGPPISTAPPSPTTPARRRRWPTGRWCFSATSTSIRPTGRASTGRSRRSSPTRASATRGRRAPARAAAGAARADGGQAGDPGLDTADWREDGPGNLRVDYVLPSAELAVAGAGVFWPAPGVPLAEAAAATPHRLVWVDLALP